jgi:hypothetical protein
MLVVLYTDNNSPNSHYCGFNSSCALTYDAYFELFISSTLYDLM